MIAKRLPVLQDQRRQRQPISADRVLEQIGDRQVAAVRIAGVQLDGRVAVERVIPQHIQVEHLLDHPVPRVRVGGISQAAVKTLLFAGEKGIAQGATEGVLAQDIRDRQQRGRTAGIVIRTRRQRIGRLRDRIQVGGEQEDPVRLGETGLLRQHIAQLDAAGIVIIVPGHQPQRLQFFIGIARGLGDGRGGEGVAGEQGVWVAVDQHRPLPAQAAHAVR